MQTKLLALILVLWGLQGPALADEALLNSGVINCVGPLAPSISYKEFEAKLRGIWKRSHRQGPPFFVDTMIHDYDVQDILGNRVDFKRKIFVTRHVTFEVSWKSDRISNVYFHAKEGRAWKAPSGVPIEWGMELAEWEAINGGPLTLTPALGTGVAFDAVVNSDKTSPGCKFVVRLVPNSYDDLHGGLPDADVLAKLQTIKTPIASTDPLIRQAHLIVFHFWLDYSR